MAGNAQSIQRVWDGRSPELRDEVMRKVRAGLRKGHVRNAMADARRQWWANRQPCFHCGGVTHKMQPVEGVDGAVECVNVKRCEYRIRRNWSAA